MKNDLFSIILLYYKQEKYIKQAIDSVLSQNYSDIELIICDDGSNLNKSEIESYIKNKKNDNIKNLIIIKNEENIGTVKTTNNAIKKSNGKFILIFASDDMLYDKNVISRFVKEFRENIKSYVITAQSILYDINLKNIFEPYVKSKQALKLNNVSAKEQYKKLAFSCLYAAGSTAYRKELFEKLNYIPEYYDIVEDLSLWIYMTHKGYTLKYVDFNALKHRDGGVSKSDLKFFTLTQKRYYEDIIKIKEYILEHNFVFNIRQKIKLVDEYRDLLLFLQKKIPEHRDILIEKNKKIRFKYWWYTFALIRRKINLFLLKIKINLQRYLKYKIISKYLLYKRTFFKFGLWLILNLICIKCFQNNLLILIFLVSNYYVSTMLYLIFIKLWRKYGKK